MDDRQWRRPPCHGCGQLIQIPGYPGTGYCKMGRGRITLLSERCEHYQFDAAALERAMEAEETQK